MSIKFHTKAASALKLAADLLEAVRMGAPARGLLEQLAGMDAAHFAREMGEDAAKKAFWINVYNAMNLLRLRKRPVRGKLSAYRHFFGRGIVVAGKHLSLNDIEHRVLRRSRRWWDAGRGRRRWIGAWERQHRVEALDVRVHFALNCGAVSCPPIRFYTAEGIDAELDIATRSFVSTEVHAMENGLVWSVSGIFKMYLHDFGGEKGIVGFLRKHRAEPVPMEAKLAFRPFDAREKLDAFV